MNIVLKGNFRECIRKVTGIQNIFQDLGNLLAAWNFDTQKSCYHKAAINHSKKHNIIICMAGKR